MWGTAATQASTTPIRRSRCSEYGYVEPLHADKRSIAVIGSGVAGLMASYMLSARDRVTLFEADTRVGGHAHTHYVDRGDGQIIGVDSAFLVHNDRTYPTLCRLFDELGVATQATDMSMSVRDDSSGLEYAGARGIGGLFPTWSSAARPRYLRMLAEVKRFHRAATRLLHDSGDDDTESLGEFVDRHGFSRYFVKHFMTPLVAAVWSCPPGDAMRYPARYLFVFLQHHGMLSVFGSPRWRTVTGGSANYVDAVVRSIDEVRAGTAVTAVRRVSGGVEVTATRLCTGTFRRCRHRHPPRPGVADAHRADRRRAERARRDALLHQPRTAAHRRIGTAPTSSGPCVVELSDAPTATTGSSSATTSPA